VPDQYRNFEPNDPLPANWTDALQVFISTVSSEFRLTRASTTTVQVVAGDDDDLVALTVDGLLRWRTTTIQRVHPGGAAATYDIHATAVPNDFEAGEPGEVDNTVYDFDLAITAAGATPAGVDHSRKVGELDWDGAKITALRQTVGKVTGAMLEEGAITGKYVDALFGFENDGALEVIRRRDGKLYVDIRDNGIADEHIPNGLIDFLKFAGLPVVKLTETTSNLSIPNNALTRVNFTSEAATDVYDGEGELGWSGDIDFITGGGSVVIAYASVAFAANATGVRRLELQMGGVTVKTIEVPSAGAAVPTHLNLIWVGNKTGDMNIAAFQNSGGNLSLLGAVATPIEMCVIAIGTDS
jgi:hypothetical protein